MDQRGLRWSQLHHGIDPRDVPLLLPWLRAMWAVARPLTAARVAPSAVTAVGAALAVCAGAVAAHHPWLGLVLVVTSVVCDGVDGAVAVLRNRATRTGARLDALADRVSDIAFAAVLWRCGAPWWLAVVAATVGLLHESARAALGGSRLARLTVSERPTRTICAVLACATVALGAGAWAPTTCAGVLVGLSVVGVAQVARV